MTTETKTTITEGKTTPKLFFSIVVLAVWLVTLVVTHAHAAGLCR